MSLDGLDISIDELEELLSEIRNANLEPLEPAQALDKYLNERKEDTVASTRSTHASRLSFFIEWCETNDVDNLNDLTGRDLLEFKQWRSQELAATTLQAHMRTLRTFLTVCVDLEAVPSDLPDKVRIPSVPKDEQAKDDTLDSDRASEILTYLESFEYASHDHIIFVLIADAGLRICSLMAIDLKDIDQTDQGTRIKLRHRPDTGTRLKNKKASQRHIFLNPDTEQAILDYIDHQRPDTTDDHGREPLLATEKGRMTDSAIRKCLYRWTRPCVIGSGCPHYDNPEDIEDCDARYSAKAHACPSSKSPHPVRRGFISNEIDEGVPGSIVNAKCDVSEEVRKLHYENPDQERRAEIRRRLREDIYQHADGSRYGRD